MARQAGTNGVGVSTGRRTREEAVTLHHFCAQVVLQVAGSTCLPHYEVLMEGELQVKTNMFTLKSVIVIMQNVISPSRKGRK